MNYKRILTIQDISCIGQCSMTVALPILSACGLETCILPSAVLSSHTGGFSRPAVCDLTEEMPRIQAHWMKEGISFDGIYTGYLGRIKQIGFVRDIARTLLVPGGKLIVDPAMGDHGKLYSGFDYRYAEAMKELCACADVVIPNITEAAMLTGRDFREKLDMRYVESLLLDMVDLGAKCVVLTGVGFTSEETGVAIWSEGKITYYHHPKVARPYHGTGDIFAASLVGAWLGGKELRSAAAIAARYTQKCIENTADDPAHWYGTKFETALPELIRMLHE